MILKLKIANQKTFQKILSLLKIVDWFNGDVELVSSNEVAESEVNNPNLQEQEQIDYSKFAGIFHGKMTKEEIDQQIAEMREE